MWGEVRLGDSWTLDGYLRLKVGEKSTNLVSPSVDNLQKVRRMQYFPLLITCWFSRNEVMSERGLNVMLRSPDTKKVGLRHTPIMGRIIARTRPAPALVDSHGVWLERSKITVPSSPLSIVMVFTMWKLIPPKPRTLRESSVLKAASSICCLDELDICSFERLKLQRFFWKLNIIISKL